MLNLTKSKRTYLAFFFFFFFKQGKISFKNLKRVAKELGENLTDEELQVGFYCLWALLHVPGAVHWIKQICRVKKCLFCTYVLSRTALLGHDFSKKCWGGRVVTYEAINARECRRLLCGAVNRSFQTVLKHTKAKWKTFHQTLSAIGEANVGRNLNISYAYPPLPFLHVRNSKTKFLRGFSF